MSQLHLYVAFISIIGELSATSLYPYESETREVRSLDGFWKFRTSPLGKPEAGFEDGWYNMDLEKTGPCLLMPVPSSFNDITVNATVRDYVGCVWYQRYFYIPEGWLKDNKKIYVRFGSVHYTATVWANGKHVGGHVGGHLPFQVDITDAVSVNDVARRVRFTVAVNNTLTMDTLPQMTMSLLKDASKYTSGNVHYSQSFDFFNYAGIHRSVVLMALPEIHVSDISINTTFNQSNVVNDIVGEVSYGISPSSPTSDLKCEISILDKDEQTVVKQTGCKNNVSISKANLWWPVDLSPNPGYLYTLKVELVSKGELDVYHLPFGIRKVTWNETKILINDVPTYLHGFGMHEDSNLRGRGLDLVHVARDFELIKWLGANAFRTSHYPYSEETLNMADKFGIVVISESPACSLNYFSENLLKFHRQVMTELVSRDKNRPSVIMWSLANEPFSEQEKAGPYFKNLVDLVKNLDSRPVTFVTSKGATYDRAVSWYTELRNTAKYMDVVCFNRFISWYQHPGNLAAIHPWVTSEIKAWHKTYKKPVLITEFGADSLSGFHELPAVMYTEDYQGEVLKLHFQAFDDVRSILAGELLWNFQDFNTPQGYNRPGRNRKGLVTRERQPKMAAHVARWRYHQLSKNLDTASGNYSKGACRQLERMPYI